MGLGLASKEIDERERESRGLEGARGDPERKMIAPPRSKGLDGDKGLQFSLWQRSIAFSWWKPNTGPGSCSLLWGRFVLVEAELQHTWASWGQRCWSPGDEELPIDHQTLRVSSSVASQEPPEVQACFWTCGTTPTQGDHKDGMLRLKALGPFSLSNSSKGSALSGWRI